MGMIGRHSGAVLALAIAALVSACDDGDARSDVARPRLEDGRIVFPQGSPQLNSFATEPVGESSPQQLRLTGRIVWDENRTVRLFPAFAGRVIHIQVKAGDRVKQGETLAMLASPDFGQAQADARRAQSDFALAEKNLSRLRELHAAGVSPRKELITAEADYARAEAELARASASWWSATSIRDRSCGPTCSSPTPRRCSSSPIRRACGCSSMRPRASSRA